MKKFINRPEDFVKETMEGIIDAYGDRVKLCGDDFRILLSGYPVKPGKVGIVTAGGFGHLPVFLGYVGRGMLDGCTVGNVFASPSGSRIAKTIQACDFGSGVLCLFGNYGGDKMNFGQAMDDCELEGIRCRRVLVTDDVASSPAGLKERRRGVAGMIYAFKCAGAAAGRMMSLDEVAAVAEKAVRNTRTIGAALSPCIVPEAGIPTFSIGEDEVEIGMGIHGEKGIEVCKMMTADEITDILMDRLLADMPLNKGDEVSVMVNGLGATPLEEQFIVYRRAARILKDKGVSIRMPHIGEYATSMEMAGLSVTVFKLDEELRELLADPADTPFYTNANKQEVSL